MFKRLCTSIIGVVMAGIGIGFLKRGAFGAAPFQVLIGGLTAALPIPFGTLDRLDADGAVYRFSHA